MAETKGNQTEAEFFAVVGTGRKGVEHMLATMGEEIKAIAAPNVNGGWETWSKRALVEIANREELAPILASRAGIFSIYKCLAKAATMGLQIGGTFPQAYLMPKDGKAVLVVTAEGYSFSAAHGPGAVLRYPPELIRVYDKDKCLIDQAQGAVKQHDITPFGDRGKLLGWYMRLEYSDGHVEVPFVAVEKVKAIQAAYSRMKDSHGNLMPSFAKSPDEMDDKTAAKRLLRKPAREAEGLSMLLSLEGPEDPAEEQPPMRTVSERVDDRLKRTLDAQGEVRGDRMQGRTHAEQFRGEPEAPAEEPEPEKPAAATDPHPEDGKQTTPRTGPPPAKGDLF